MATTTAAGRGGGGGGAGRGGRGKGRGGGGARGGGGEAGGDQSPSLWLSDGCLLCPTFTLTVGSFTLSLRPACERACERVAPPSRPTALVGYWQPPGCRFRGVHLHFRFVKLAVKK